MKSVTLTCDRCEAEIYGLDGLHGTTGFYRVVETAWAKYALPGEQIICDQCMWDDERYLNDYPHMRSTK